MGRKSHSKWKISVQLWKSCMHLACSCHESLKKIYHLTVRSATVLWFLHFYFFALCFFCVHVNVLFFWSGYDLFENPLKQFLFNVTTKKMICISFFYVSVKGGLTPGSDPSLCGALGIFSGCFWELFKQRVKEPLVPLYQGGQKIQPPEWFPYQWIGNLCAWWVCSKFLCHYVI